MRLYSCCLAGNQDVIAAVNVARQHNLTVAAQGGAHWNVRCYLSHQQTSVRVVFNGWQCTASLPAI